MNLLLSKDYTQYDDLLGNVSRLEAFTYIDSEIMKNKRFLITPSIDLIISSNIAEIDDTMFLFDFWMQPQLGIPAVATHMKYIGRIWQNRNMSQINHTAEIPAQGPIDATLSIFSEKKLLEVPDDNKYPVIRIHSKIFVFYRGVAPDLSIHKAWNFYLDMQEV